jgi:hypothetical protein
MFSSTENPDLHTVYSISRCTEKFLGLSHARVRSHDLSGEGLG